MQRMLVFLLFVIFFPSQVLAGVGDSDNRYYVTDEMWAQEPYKKFVYFEVMAKDGKELVPSGHCSAQYISPNLILSAGHCTDKDADGYRVKNYKQEEFLVELIETPYDGKTGTLGDWAVWLVTEPKYYSNSYFDLKTPTKTIDILNAGWGWVRIIDDEELKKIREIFENVQEVYETKSISDAIYYLDIYLHRRGIEGIDEFPSKFKASECKIVFEDCSDMNSHLYDGLDKIQDASQKKQKKWMDSVKKKEEKIKNICNNQTRLRHRDTFPNILATTCDSWGGNSGGGYISSDGKFLYGICSFGADDFTDSGNTDFITSTLQFEKRIKELIKTFSSKNSVEDNISKIPKNIFGEDSNETGTETDEVVQQKMFQRMDSRIQRLTTETTDLDKILISALPNVKKMTDEELLKFLDKMSEYKIKSERLAELQKAYEEAKANEQSLANRTLTALTVAATGIGGMELARGLAEQKADKEAEASMTAYIETMRCTYGDGKQVKAGPEEIELPGGNNAELMKLRSEYFALAADLKERKEALGMKPGIESEVIMDKSEMGLYDDENIGITDGAYASLYRAKALNSETDQAKINEDKEASKKRVIGGGVAAGVGVVGSVVGSSLINGKLGEKIKNSKNNKNDSDIKEKMNELCSMGACKSETIKNMNDDQIKQVINKIAQMKQLKQQGNTDEPEVDLSNIGEILKNKNLIK